MVMNTKIQICVLLIFLCLVSDKINAQDRFNKISGVGFRVDDNQYDPSEKLIPYVNLFNSKDIKFTYAVNFGSNISQALLSYLPQMQADGHEIADHTPDHRTKYFWVNNGSPYLLDPGLDHIRISPSPIAVCLKIDHVNTNTYVGEGLISIVGNTLTASDINEFSNVTVAPGAQDYPMYVIYIPSLDICLSYSEDSVVGNQIFNLKSFWDEDINIIVSNVEYHKLGVYDVFYTAEALQLLAKRTQEFCTPQTGILKPTSWIQPGGDHPQFFSGDLKNALESLGYKSGGVFANPSSVCYNEYDPNKDKRFGINWGDFQEDAKQLAECKKIIANRFAKHYLSIGRSHLTPENYGTTWQAYLNKTEALLDWCIQKGIPVKTYYEWSEQLYNTPQNPYVNVMPKLEVDLDENNEPDGFDEIYVNLDKTDGPNLEFPFSLLKTNNGWGYFFKIYNLGGIEKDTCSFSFWAKGGIGSNLVLEILINGSSSNKRVFNFTIQNSGWQKYSLLNTTSSNKYLIIPQDCSIIGINMIGPDGSGGTKVAGFSLKKFSSTSIIPSFLTTPSYTANSVNLNWIDNSNNEDGFRVKRKVQGETNFREIVLLPNNSIFATDELLNIPTSLLINDSISIYYYIEAFTGTDSVKSNVEIIRIASAGVLPVELSSFTARTRGNIVNLYWETQTEVSNFGFEIERTIKNKNEWKMLDFIPGNGNSNSPKYYRYIDSTITEPSTYVYRLKQIDSDGKFEYSKDIEVEVFLPQENVLYQNYPNPFNSSTTISYSIKFKNDVKIILYNALGEQMRILKNEIQEPGSYEILLQLDDFCSGIYFYQIQSGSFVQTKKMIILK